MTIGQYLQPHARRLPVERYVTPEEFERWREIGMQMGFKHVESSPLTRSSYHARQQAESEPLRRKISRRFSRMRADKNLAADSRGRTRIRINQSLIEDLVFFSSYPRESAFIRG